MTRSSNDIQMTKTVSSISLHSLAVTDLHITVGRNPRILSVSLDHTVHLYSLCAKQTLIKLSVDVPITACTMNQSETTIFLGGTNGKVYLIDITMQVQLNQLLHQKINLKFLGIRLE